jgi:hypothetical protein
MEKPNTDKNTANCWRFRLARIGWVLCSTPDKAQVRS